MNTYKVTAKITEQKSLIYTVNANDEKWAKFIVQGMAIRSYGTVKVTNVVRI